MKPYAIGLYEKAIPGDFSFRDKLICAKECGYDFLEISIDETDAKLSRLDWSAEERLQLVNTMKEVGLPIRSMCLSGHRKYPFGDPDPAVRARSLEIMEKAVILADDLGVRIIQLAGYDVYYKEGTEETRKLFEENLAKATAMAACRGIVLGFETMETPFMNTTSLDYGTTVPDDLETGRGHIFALHLKETVPGKFREIPFLTGHVDFDAVVKKAWELGIRRFVTEMWYVGQDSWKEDIKFANRSMSAVIDKYANA